MDVLGPEAFYIIKGLIGVTAVGVLIVHMNRSWSTFDASGGIGQRLRYITLFYFAVFISSVSYQQVRDQVRDITLQTIGALGGIILLLITAFVSLAEARNRRIRRH